MHLPPTPNTKVSCRSVYNKIHKSGSSKAFEKSPKFRARRILHGFHPKDNGSQHKHLCSIIHLPSLFAHSKAVSVASRGTSNKTQQSVFHITHPWVPKTQLLPYTLFSPLKNKDKSRKSHCVKSIFQLNLLHGKVQIRPAACDHFLLPCSKTPHVCVAVTNRSQARAAGALHKRCDSTRKLHPNKQKNYFRFFYSWCVFTFTHLTLFMQH